MCILRTLLRNHLKGKILNKMTDYKTGMQLTSAAL